ncbi:hypothetical protein HWV62_12092 [Athelia sp. TMB]|nr:hypothetical protein HWV62_12092 [Athelia sp. TMB]
MSASTKHSNVDVLIVGAGPAGLMCSYALAKAGIKVTLHQGAIEEIFLDAMKELGLTVDRQTVPLSMQLSTDEAELGDSNAYPVKANKQFSREKKIVSLIDVMSRWYFIVRARNPADPKQKLSAARNSAISGAHSWVRKSMEITMQGGQTEYIWGVIDFVPKTDLPDMRNLCMMHSDNGTCLLIPREDDSIRLYVQLSEIDVIDPSTGRVDPKRMGPLDILEVARKSIHPYQIATPDTFECLEARTSAERDVGNLSAQNGEYHAPGPFNSIQIWNIKYELERRQYALDLIDFDRKWAALMSSKVSHEEFFQAFKTHNDFTSGLSIQYPESPIVNCAHESAAKHITIGQRIPPQVLIRVADGRPSELLDLLPADTRFKILLFVGDITPASQSPQRVKLEKLAEELKSMLVTRSVGCEWGDTFDIITIATGKSADLDYIDAPIPLRSHWSKVFVDEADLFGDYPGSGKAYDKFGIGDQGAGIIVRPDGYVGAVFPLDAIGDAGRYFEGFIRAQRS